MGAIEERYAAEVEAMRMKREAVPTKQPAVAKGRKKGKGSRVRRGPEPAIALESPARRELAKLGLVLRIGDEFHWMIETKDGKRLLNYWPTTGSYTTCIYTADYGYGRGKLRDWHSAIELAKAELKRLPAPRIVQVRPALENGFKRFFIEADKPLPNTAAIRV